MNYMKYLVHFVTEFIKRKMLDSAPQQCPCTLLIGSVRVFGTHFHTVLNTVCVLRIYHPTIFVHQLQIAAVKVEYNDVTTIKILKKHRC